MKAFRNTGAHLKAMPKLIGSCAEASVVHWNSEEASIPAPAQIAERMKGGGTSKVRYPSPAHVAGDPWPDRKVPLKGPLLTP